MTTPLRIGVVGVGSLGFHHARISRDIPGCEDAGFFEVDPDRARAVAEQLSMRAHDSLDSLLDTSDAVVIAVPTTAHEEVAVRALAHGCAVFIEKPLAPSLESADRILEAARTAGRIVQVGHVERFNGVLIAARPYLGEPVFIESHRLAPFVPRSMDVAVVLDLMIHDVDLVRSLVGVPIASLAATGVPVLTSNIDIANARIEFENGAVANLTASRVSRKKMRELRIFQRSGYLSLDLAERRGEFLRLRQALPAMAPSGGVPDLPVGGLEALVERIAIEGDDVEPLRRELEAFRDAALGLTAPAVPGEEGRAALETSLWIQERIERHVADSRPKKT
jgi:predicted dehydrogenase